MRFNPVGPWVGDDTHLSTVGGQNPSRPEQGVNIWLKNIYMFINSLYVKFKLNIEQYTNKIYMY